MLHMRAIALCTHNVYSASHDDPPTLIYNCYVCECDLVDVDSLLLAKWYGAHDLRKQSSVILNLSID